MFKAPSVRYYRNAISISSLLLASAFVPQVEASTIYAIQSSNSLLRFDSASPGTINQTTPVTGLANGENLLGIDFRPTTGQLYGLSSASRIYTLDTFSGAASIIGFAGAFTLNGSTFGFDFNPVADRLRITSNTGQNIRVNPTNGALVATDGGLFYAPGDANAGVSTNISASAYTNSVAGALSTTLYDIDAILGVLAVQNPPNSGTLTTVGSLGLGQNVSFPNGFDIEPVTGIAYAGFRDFNGLGSSLYTINLASGAATLVGGIGSGQQISGLAVVTDAPEPATFGLIGMGLAGAVFLRRMKK